MVIASANFIFPPQIRARGAHTIYWDMYLRRRVGTPTEPADPALVVPRANRFYEYATAAMGCTTPMITLNELFGANTITPWTPANAQYRANVLAYVRALRARGARPVLLISSAPYTEGEAREWWRAVGEAAHIVREVYFPAPMIYRQGPIVGNRTLRTAFRRGASQLITMGVPASRVGIMLGFHTTLGTGGREGLKPASAWFRTVKWQVLAAKRVARELRLAHVWSWGWATYAPTPIDPDKEAAACVWLWVRNPKLCNGPAEAGPRFDASLTEGQPIFRRGTRCTVGDAEVRSEAIARITRLTGDAQVAFTATFARAVAGRRVDVSTKEVLEAERTIIRLRFGGSRSAYRVALARARASVATARGAIVDELRRARLARHLRVGRPSAEQIEQYYETFANVPARFVDVQPAASWLGNRKSGFALASVAPGQIFAAPVGRRQTVRTLGATFKIRARGEAVPLGALPLAKVRASISAALIALAREQAYDRWLLRQQHAALDATICWRDQLPAVGIVPLTDYLPFLALEAGSVTERR